MRLLACSVLLAGLWTFSASVEAQDPQETPNETDTEGARFLFRQGLELVELEDWSRAADRFRSALRLRSSPAIAYNLAAALFELGQLNEAEELVAELHADEETPEELRATAWTLAGRIPAAGGMISIRIDGPAEGVQVFLDDREIPSSRLGVAMTASLGAHVIHARRDGELLAHEDVTVSRDGRADVVLVVADDLLLPTNGAAVDLGDADGDEGSSLLSDWRFWGVVGGGVLLVAVVVLIAVVAGGGGAESPIIGDFQPGVLTWP